MAITLLIVHVINLTGVPLLLTYLINRSAVRLSEKIERNEYRSGDLIEVKIALNAPYIGTWQDYERYDGEVTVDGVRRQYVKRKVQGDTLFLLCLPNKTATKLIAAKSTLGKWTADFPANQKDAGSASKKPVDLNQYQERDLVFHFSTLRVVKRQVSKYILLPLPRAFIPVNGKPPEINS